MLPKKPSKIISLQQRRNERNRVVRKGYLTPEERIGELEADMLRLIDHSLGLEESVNFQAALLRRLVRLLRRYGVSSSSGKQRGSASPGPDSE